MVLCLRLWADCADRADLAVIHRDAFLALVGVSSGEDSGEPVFPVLLQRGFTLLELVMVVVILGLLATVAIPRFMDLQSKARASVANAELGALRAAAIGYYASTAAHGGTVGYPVNKAVLTNLLSTPLEILDPAVSSYGWSYDPVSSRIAQSGNWP